jgi:hypothetical protein
MLRCTAVPSHFTAQTAKTRAWTPTVARHYVSQNIVLGSCEICDECSGARTVIPRYTNNRFTSFRLYELLPLANRSLFPAPLLENGKSIFVLRIFALRAVLEERIKLVNRGITVFLRTIPIIVVIFLTLASTFTESVNAYNLQSWNRLPAIIIRCLPTFTLYTLYTLSFIHYFYL